MACTKCTFTNDFGREVCAMCDFELIHNDGENDFKIKPVVNGSHKVYKITKEYCDLNSVSKENEKFNIAAAQFSKLCNVTIKDIIQIDVIVYSQDSEVLRRYVRFKADKHQKLGQAPKEAMVFHGTGKEANFESIVSDGFKVGGQGIPIVNGASYGQGVYTSLTPTTPIAYSHGMAKVILAKGIIDESDTIAPNAEWRIFRKPEQLLPTYIVHFSSSQQGTQFGVPLQNQLTNVFALQQMQQQAQQVQQQLQQQMQQQAQQLQQQQNHQRQQMKQMQKDQRKQLKQQKEQQKQKHDQMQQIYKQGHVLQQIYQKEVQKSLQSNIQPSNALHSNVNTPKALQHSTEPANAKRIFKDIQPEDVQTGTMYAKTNKALAIDLTTDGVIPVKMYASSSTASGILSGKVSAANTKPSTDTTITIDMTTDEVVCNTYASTTTLKDKAKVGNTPRYPITDFVISLLDDGDNGAVLEGGGEGPQLSRPVQRSRRGPR